MLVKIGPVAALPAGSATHFIAGDEAVAVCNVGGEIYAMDGICPHSGGPLGHGALEGHLLACPFHGWEFDCRTGECSADGSIGVAIYPVKIEDDQIFVELP